MQLMARSSATPSRLKVLSAHRLPPRQVPDQCDGQFQDLLDRTDVFHVVETYDFAYNTENPIEITHNTEDVICCTGRYRTKCHVFS